MIVKYRAKSYKVKKGKWVPSGIVEYSDSEATLEVNESFNSTPKNTKKEADDYFTLKAKKGNKHF